MSQKPKYREGDLVEMFGNKARILKVHESQYFAAGDEVHFLYDIEYTIGGTQAGVMEVALTLIESSQRKQDSLCECGAWAVHWATDEHSDWCPAAYYSPYKEKK